MWKQCKQKVKTKCSKDIRNLQDLLLIRLQNPMSLSSVSPESHYVP